MKASSVESSFRSRATDALAIVSDAEAVEAKDENVGVMALDPVFQWLDRVILDLQLDACYFQRDKSPGRWREGPIGVTGDGGRILYQRFCVEAHTAQARRRLEQIAEAAARWRYLEDLVESRGWPERLIVALEQSLIGGTDRASYEKEAGISSATASTDFRRLLDAGLIIQAGRGRNIRYHARDDLRAQVSRRDLARGE